MSKRDKETKDKNFNNPFGALKGLSASVPPGKVPVAGKKAPSAPLAPTEVKVDESELSFADAMLQLGVRQKEPAGDELPPSRHFMGRSAPEDLPAQSATHEKTSAHERERLQRLKRSLPYPEAELDLHGMTAAQALAKVTWFLDNAIFHGCQVVRIITGRGKSSEAGPVLRPQVEAYLDGPGRRQVLEWSQAPQAQGGEGALIVFLRLPEIGDLA